MFEIVARHSVIKQYAIDPIYLNIDLSRAGDYLWAIAIMKLESDLARG